MLLLCQYCVKIQKYFHLVSRLKIFSVNEDSDAFGRPMGTYLVILASTSMFDREVSYLEVDLEW